MLDEVYHLLPEDGATLDATTYYITVVAEREGSFSGTIRSEGEIPLVDLGTLAPLVTHNYSMPAGELELLTFNVPVDALAVEVLLEQGAGSSNFGLRADDLPANAPSVRNNFYGFDGGNANDANGRSDSTGDALVATLQNPIPGTYSLTLRADSGVSAASGTLNIRVIEPPVVALEGGSVVVSNHQPLTWKYFEVNIPDDGRLPGDQDPILAWNAFLSNQSGISTLSAGTILTVLKNTAFTRPDNSVAPFTSDFDGFPAQNTEWLEGRGWSQRSDLTRRTTSATGVAVSRQYFMASWGKPLDGGTYIVGIFNSSGSTIPSYTFNSRTVGEAGSSSSIQVQDIPFVGGQATVNDLSPRDFAVFRTTVPAAGAASWRARIENLAGESSLSIREGFVPDFQGGGEVVSISPNDERSSQGGGVLAQRFGDEYFSLFPEEGQPLIPGDREFYMVATSEGFEPDNSTIGTGDVSLVLHSDGEVPSTVLDLSSGLVVADDVAIKGGEVQLYTFTVPANASSLEVELTDKSDTFSGVRGNLTTLQLRQGPLVPITGSRFNYQSSYGVAEGTEEGSLSDSNIVTVIEPAPGLYTLAVRSSPSTRDEQVVDATFDLRVEVLAPRLLDFCGGTETQIDQPPNSLRVFQVTVPDNPNYLAWDVGIDPNYVGGRPELLIRRTDLPVLTPLTNSEQVSLNQNSWAEGLQLQPSILGSIGTDWTNDRSHTNGNLLSNTRRVLRFGRPLEAGTYFVGVFNDSSSEATSYTINSSCVAPAGSLPDIDDPVTTLSFSGAGNSATITDLEPREARYFRVDIPANTRSWRVLLESEAPDETTLAIDLDYIPALSSQSGIDPNSIGNSAQLQRAGDETFTLLPDDGEEFIEPATYFLAVVALGTDGTFNNVGSGTVSAVLTSVGEVTKQNLGVIGVNSGAQITENLALNPSELQIVQFTVPSNPNLQNEGVLEIRLENKVGPSRFTLLKTDTLIPEPIRSSSYGYSGGTRFEEEDEQIITLVNPEAGIYTLTLFSDGSLSAPLDATADLIIENVGVSNLSFDSRITDTPFSAIEEVSITDGQRRYFRVDVPQFITFEGTSGPELLPLLGWRVSLVESIGDVRMRINSSLSDSGGLSTAFGDDIAIVAPPILTPGATFYIEVEGNGLADFTIESSVVEYETIWSLPTSYNQEFGVSGEIDLGEDDWDFYAIDVPNDNGGLLRTELVALSGNPDLYIREDGVPTITHRETLPVANGNIVDRSLTSTNTEFANWVPLDGRIETELAPGRWVIGVRARDANSRYNLRVSTGTVEVIDYETLQLAGTTGNINEIVGASVLQNDFRYYQIEIPELPATSAELAVTFSEVFGDVNLHLRDTIPPGNSNVVQGGGERAVIDADDDNKNRWSFWGMINSGIDEPGTTNFTFPELRPGETYFIGMRGRTDGTFDLDVSPSSTLITDNYGVIDTIAFSGEPAGHDYTVAAGETRTIRVQVPEGARRWVSNHLHSSDVDVLIEQGTPPNPLTTSNSNVHRFLSGTNTSFNQVLAGVWPWVPGEDYFILIRNDGSVAETVNITLSGEGEETPFEGFVASFGLVGSDAGAEAVNNPRGVPNLLAYAFNLSPITGLPATGVVNPVTKLILSEDEPPFAGLEFFLPLNPPADLCYAVEENSNLTGEWTELVTRAGNGGWVGTGFVFEGPNVNGFQRLQVFSPFSTAGVPHSFYRLRVELTHQ